MFAPLCRGRTRMFLLVFKVVLTPLLIALATLIGRRWGHGISGWFAALPLTSGPVSLIFALQNGTDFASHAAVGTIAGLASVAAFCFTFSRVAARRRGIVSAVIGLGAFLLTTAALNQFPLMLVPAFAGVVIVLVIAFRAMPVEPSSITVAAPPWWDLWARMIVATSFVLLLTALSSLLGPQLSGLFSPFPIFASVLAVFAHHRSGAAASVLVLRGILLGLFAFASFFLVVGLLVTRVDLVWAYALAAIVAIMVNVLSLRFAR